MEMFTIFLCTFVVGAFGDLQRIEKSQEAESMRPRQADPLKAMAASYSAMRYFLKALPDMLKSKIFITDDAEKVVLENYVKSRSVPTKALDAYNLAKKDERELLKRLFREVPQFVSAYKALRKGVAWKYTRLNDKFKQFFQEPSIALAQFEALKRDELTSLDSFLSDSSQNDSSQTVEDTKHISAVEAETKTIKVKEAEVNGADKLTIEEVELAEAQEAENRKLEEQLKANEAENRKEEEIGKTPEAENRMEEEKGKAEEANNQKENKTGTAEEINNQKEEEKSKAEKRKEDEIDNAQEAETQKEDKGKAEEAENQKREDKGKAKEAENRKKEDKGKAEEAENRKGEDIGKGEEEENQNEKGTVKAEDTDKRKEKYNSKAEEAEKGKG